MTTSKLNLRTNESLFLTRTSEGLVVGVNGMDMITLNGDTSMFIECLTLMDGALDAEEISRHMVERGFDAVEVGEIISFCLSENICKANDYAERKAENLIDEYSFAKWDRQIRNFASLPEVDYDGAIGFQERLQNSTVAILGLGGVGSYIALSAAMMGVRQIVLIDFDHVELSNTSRQVLYTESDLGLSKIEVADREIKRHSPSCKTLMINCKVDSPADVKMALKTASASGMLPDFVFVAADTPRGQIQYFVDEACQDWQVPSMNLGPHGFSKLSMGPMIVPGVTPSLAELLPQRGILDMSSGEREINDRFAPNIMDPYNAMVAKMGVIEAVKLITGYREPTVINSVVVLDTEQWEIERFDIRK